MMSPISAGEQGRIDTTRSCVASCFLTLHRLNSEDIEYICNHINSHPSQQPCPATTRAESTPTSQTRTTPSWTSATLLPHPTTSRLHRRSRSLSSLKLPPATSTADPTSPGVSSALVLWVGVFSRGRRREVRARAFNLMLDIRTLYDYRLIQQRLKPR